MSAVQTFGISAAHCVVLEKTGGLIGGAGRSSSSVLYAGPLILILIRIIDFHSFEEGFPLSFDPVVLHTHVAC